MGQDILKLFLYKDKLRFNEIEKGSGKRSNSLSYHIKKMLHEGMIAKDHGFYRLADGSEIIIPYLTEKRQVLPVVLVAIGKKGKIFLHKREKRPYKGLLGLPGGRMLMGETVEDAATRIMREKFNVKCKFERVNSVSVENVRKNSRVVHSFLLILVTATARENLDYSDIEKSRKGMIASDYRLIKTDLDSVVKIRNIASRV
jgi:ADP-ribose pyrophosphatase YjhB (NUDIX family)